MLLLNTMNNQSTWSSFETHKDFKLNKHHYTATELKEVAYSLVKEGEPYEERVGNFLLDWLNATAFVEVQTSGSTGKPKIIKLKKEHMINSAKATAKSLKLKESSTALLCLPAQYIGGKMMLVRAMVLGLNIDLVPPSSTPLEHVYKRYDFCAMTPFQLDNSIARLHLVKKLIVGGGTISSHLAKLVQGVNTKIYETYGMTETCSHVAIRRVNPKKEKKDAKAFKALPKVTVKIDDRDCLVIKAPLLADEDIVTNDIVELVTYKKFIWRGRYDNVINSGGVKLYPEEIERKLTKIIGHRFFVGSVADDALGEKLVLLVEREFSEQAKSDLLLAISKLKSLDKFERPKQVIFIEKFEETQSGKIHRLNTLDINKPI